MRCVSFIIFFAGILIGHVYAQFPFARKGKWGVMDEHGQTILEADFNCITVCDSSCIAAVRDSLYGLYNPSGRLLVEHKYSYISKPNAGILRVNHQYSDSSAGMSLWGLYSLQTNKLVEPVYSFIDSFKGSWALINIAGVCDYDTCIGGRWGIIDNQLKEVLPVSYRQVRLVDAEEAFVKNDSGWGRIDEQGRITIIPGYGSLERITPTWLIASNKGQFGVITNEEVLRVPLQYEFLKYAGHGYLAYSSNGRLYGLMDSLGRKLTREEYADITVLDHYWVRVKKGRNFAILDTTGQMIFNPVLSATSTENKPSLIVRRGLSWGVINRKGEMLVPFKYDEIIQVNDTLLRAKWDGYYKWLDPMGNQVRRAIYDEIAPFDGKVVKIRHRGRWGLINERGELLAPPKFSKLQVFKTAARGYYQGRWEFIYFDEDGAKTKVRKIVLKKQDKDVMFEEDAFLTELGFFYSTSRMLWGLKKPGTNKVLIKPSYRQIRRVPGSDRLAIYSTSGADTLGILDFKRGKEVTDPLFREIEIEDFDRFPVARARYMSSGKFCLISKEGEVLDIGSAGYIGGFISGYARVNIGGTLETAELRDMRTLYSSRYFDQLRRVWKEDFWYCNGGKWGFIDTLGNWKKSPDFQYAQDFTGKSCRVQQNGKWGVIDRDFNMTIEAKYDFIDLLNPGEELEVWKVGFDARKYGYLDAAGFPVILPEFGDAAPFSEGMARVKTGNGWSFIDKRGHRVISGMFDDAGDFHNGYARVLEEKGWTYVDREGNLLTTGRFLRAKDFSEGLAAVQKGEFFGYMDTSGTFVINPEYTTALPFSEGLAAVRTKVKYGLINKKGNKVLAPKFFRIEPFCDSIARVQLEGDFGLLRPDGSFILKPSYKVIGGFSEGLARVKEKMSFGFINKQGELEIGMQFPNVQDFSEGLAGVFVSGKWGFIDQNGEIVIEPQFVEAHEFSEGRAAVRIGNKWGFIDRNGVVVVPPVFTEVKSFSGRRAGVLDAERGWGFCDEFGVMILPCEFDEVADFEFGIAGVKKNGKWGLVGEYGNYVAIPKYEEIGSLSEGLRQAKLIRRYGLIDYKGNDLLPVIYDEIGYDNPVVNVEKDGMKGCFSLSGKWIRPVE